jgi:hypothetical protein
VWALTGLVLALRQVWADCGPWWDPLTWGCDVGSALSSAGQAIENFFGAAGAAIWNAITTPITNAYNAIVNTAIGAVWSSVVAVLSAVFTAIQEGVVWFINETASLILGAWSFISASFAGAGPWAPALTAFVFFGGLLAIVVAISLAFKFIWAAGKTAFNLL